MLATPMPAQNRILAVLPSADLDRLMPHLQLVSLHNGQVLYEAGSHLEFIYFPVTAIVAKIHETNAGESAEIALVGREGAVGVALYLGGDIAPNRASVIAAGTAFRLPARILKDELFNSDVLLEVLPHYTQALMAQIFLAGACYRHHRLDQQLARWLLAFTDRTGSNDLVITQQQISLMLGVRREGITESAGRLQHLGAIRYSRGHIVVLNRTILEHASCECYNVVKKEHARLFNQVPPPAKTPLRRPAEVTPTSARVQASIGGT